MIVATKQDSVTALRGARRILILGPAGAGKSTFSVQLAAMLQLPVVHLDKYFWKPGWTPSAIDDFARELRALAQQDGWIMDGNYGRTLFVRAPYADHAVSSADPQSGAHGRFWSGGLAGVDVSVLTWPQAARI